MRIYFSPSAAGFFTDRHHGPRTSCAPDPAWKRPRGKAGASAEPPLIEVPNPASKIPADAVEITAEEHQALLAAQASGKLIVPGADGRPTTVGRPPASYDRRRARAYGSWRDQLEMIYRDLKTRGIDGEFTRHVEAVKTAHPKP